MTPKQIRDARFCGKCSAGYIYRPGNNFNGKRCECTICPSCKTTLVRHARTFDTADSDINVFVCNAFSDGTVLHAAPLTPRPKGLRGPTL